MKATDGGRAIPICPSSLTVFYDDDCPFCRRCMRWLRREATDIPLILVPASAAPERFQRLPWLRRELVVADELGHVWAGPAAFVMCLWALERTRELAVWLAQSWLEPLVWVFFDLLSSSRGTLSTLFTAERCDGACGVEPNPTSPAQGVYR